MIAIFVTAAALLAAGPEVGVVKRTSNGVSEATIAVVLHQIDEGLKREGLTARPLPKTCNDSKCVAALARSSGLPAAVGVTVLVGRRDITVDLEALDDQARKLAVQTFGVPASGTPFPQEGAEFFRALKNALAPPVVADAPRVVQLEPQGEPAAELAAVAPRSPVLRITAATTIASGAVGLGLLIASGIVKGNLDARLKAPVISGTRADAQAQADLANGLGTASILTLGIAGAAAIATGVLWFQQREPQQSEAEAE